MEIVKISKVKPNPENPRVITDDNFNKLVESIKAFPEMLELRPIVVNSEYMVLGGNMRLKACKTAGLKEVPVLVADKLTAVQEREFLIKDNLSMGEWDWDVLKGTWQEEELETWGLETPLEDFENVDYFEVEKTEKKQDHNKITDDNYSQFELIMLHENKLQLIETLNKVKNNFLFERQEEALMEIIRQFNNQ